MYTEVYVCRKQVVIVHESFVLNIVSTDVVAIIHGSFVLEWVCIVSGRKGTGSFKGPSCRKSTGRWYVYDW